MEWPEAAARLRTPIFAPLAPLLARLPRDEWPCHDALTALAAGLRTEAGHALRFVPPESAAGDRRPYEQRIAETGEVPTRARNWHDLFNALAWIAYPRTKARINAQHAAILAERGPAELRHRGAERDALTLFDEGGVIVASRDPELLALIAAFEWKALFWERRGALASSVRFFAIGHGAFEQALAPYIGMVAKTVFVEVDEAFFALGDAAAVRHADALAAARLADRAAFASPRRLAPLPILGVPGWHFAPQDEAFYDDAAHFRSKGPRRKG